MSLEENERLDAAREALLKKPYRILDVLPGRTPEEFAAAYSALEKYSFRDPAGAGPYGGFLSLLTKLACFCDMAACRPEGSDWVRSPGPDHLFKALSELADTRRGGLHLLIDGGKLLMTLDAGDLYMTVYGSSPRAMRRIKSLARSEGLFVWKK